MKYQRISLLALDFKPMTGGVAEYSFQLADSLHKHKLLDRVITPAVQTNKYSFKVDAPQELRWSKFLIGRGFLLRKVYSMLYLIQLRWIELRGITQLLIDRRRTLLIVNWVVSPLARRWISILQSLGIDYGVVLHGKDIIVASEGDEPFFSSTCARAELLIFNSYATAALFRDLQPSNNTDWYVLYPGIDIDQLNRNAFSSREDLENLFSVDLKEKLIVSTVSRLVKRKGIDLAIRAIEPIAKENENLVYLIVGDGEEYEPLKSLISSLGLDDQVKLLGNLIDRDKFSLLGASSIFLMPNHCQRGHDFEGFGISFIEASYFKNAVVGGRSGGVVEAVKDGCSGFLVDADSCLGVESIRDALMKLLADTARMQQMAEWGHQYVLENFQAEKLVNDFARHVVHPHS